MNSSRAGDRAVEVMRRVGRVWAGISAGCQKSVKSRRRYGIGNGARLGEFRVAGNLFKFVGGEIPERPTFAENLARWLGVVEAMGKRGTTVDEFGEGVMALGRNWQGGEERGSVDIDRPHDRFPWEFEVELTNEF